ncbi:MAG TPA: hypothetical protein VHC69_17445 [Polyangiaceae bacterium]|nr:hypothetical protein [Polyangiaceae bacterium]
MHAVRKYLAAWAEPEAALAGAVDGGYSRCLVVPACRERASLLDGYLRAAATSSGRTLCVLVVNGRDGEVAACTENAALLAELRATLAGVRAVPRSPESGVSAFVGATAESALDVLVVDRASGGAQFPKKAGVGLARKIGVDVALALRVAGKVESALVFCTDADVTLPERHFERPELAPGSRRTSSAAGAAVFPFWHEPSSDEAITRATALYELSLRYYVAGLAAAGSPYAFHTLGSAMAVDCEAYAAVRGAPNREAGEDFYLLAKIAKVKPLVRTDLPMIRIQSRASDRTPFGTGAYVARGVAGGERLFYAPETFAALGRFLRSLDAASSDGSADRFLDARGGLRADEWDAVARTLFGPKGRASFVAAALHATSSDARRVRLHDWFDAFRTLKFVHALRDSVWRDVPFRDALSRAPFAPFAQGANEASLDANRVAFMDQEAGTKARFGSSALSPDTASP